MKKYMIAVLIVVIALTAVACNSGKEVWTQTYEVGGDSMSHDVFNHENVISDKTVHTKERTVGEKTSFSTASRSYSLSYSESIFYPLKNRKVHKYLVDSSEDEGSVLLNEDGSLYAILRDDIALIDISKTDTAETVQAALEPAIADLVDLSKYDEVEVQHSGNSVDGSFGRYRFFFYDELQGYRGGYTTVMVYDDGRVGALWINDLLIDANKNLPVIDKEKEEMMIQKRLQAIYNTDTTEYRSHTLFDMPSLCTYGNELCIYYRLNVTLYETDLSSETSGYTTELLIPVRLLTES